MSFFGFETLRRTKTYSKILTFESFRPDFLSPAQINSEGCRKNKLGLKLSTTSTSKTIVKVVQPDFFCADFRCFFWTPSIPISRPSHTPNISIAISIRFRHRQNNENNNFIQKQISNKQTNIQTSKMR